MATILAGCSVPHNPFLPNTVVADPEGIDARCFADVAERIRALAPDVVVSFSPDHLNTLFFDNLPSLLIGIVDEFSGPNDDYPAVIPQRIASEPELARHLFHHALREEFDLARSEDLEVDHSVLVPLQVMDLTPKVVPIVMNVLAPPIMNATRAHAFGAAIGRGIRAFDRPLTVLLLADGGIIQEVGGPRSEAGKPAGAPDKEWLALVAERLRAGEVDRLLAEATPRRLAEVGNAAGELLTVLAVLGALGEPPLPGLIETEPEIGHMFGFWSGAEAI